VFDKFSNVIKSIPKNYYPGHYFGIVMNYNAEDGSSDGHFVDIPTK